jgi:hypothetical protein
MPQPHFIKRFAGLSASGNAYWGAAEGALESGQNACHTLRDVIESRRGYSTNVVGNLQATDAMGFYPGGVAIWLNYPTDADIGSSYSYDFRAGGYPGVGVFNAFGGSMPIDRPAGDATARTHFAVANKAMYFQSRYGLVKFEFAGPPPLGDRRTLHPLHPPNWTQTGTTLYGSRVALSGTGTAWFATAKDVAYRFTICRLGANKELIESEPSDRLVLQNASGLTKSVTVTLQNSWMMRSDTFFRIYRTKQVVSGAETGDEMWLVAEVLPTGGTDADGYFLRSATTAYTDQSDDTSLIIPLYTNPISGQGSASAKATAPCSRDLVWFKSRMYYLNTIDVQRLTVRIIGTGTGGIVDGDTISINAIKFTFKAAPVNATDVQLSTGGTVAANVEATGRALAATVNRYFGSTFAGPLYGAILARYVSLTASDAGQVLLQSVVPNSDAFTVTTSSANGWSSNYTTATASDANPQVAGLAWSEQDEPEAVPLDNFAIVGDASEIGQRLIALKDTLFVFKNDGLWKVTDDGTTDGVDLQPVDPTVRLVASDSAVAVDNMIAAFCDQGVVLITETGAAVNISHTTVERELFKLAAYVGATTMEKRAFAIGYLPEHTYILSLPESPNATGATKQYVYNLQTDTWSDWALPRVMRSGGLNRETGQLVWGPSFRAGSGSSGKTTTPPTIRMSASPSPARSTPPLERWYSVETTGSALFRRPQASSGPRTRPLRPGTCSSRLRPPTSCKAGSGPSPTTAPPIRRRWCWMQRPRTRGAAGKS